jgi:undecaprenyl diphosphate synthase
VSSVTEYNPYTDEELDNFGLTKNQIPKHLAVIMDGNGRWAISQGLKRAEGHRRGVRTVRMVVEECSRFQMEHLTLYCLSSENWKRPRYELNILMHLLQQYVVEERSEIMKQNIRFNIIGRQDGLSQGVLDEVQKTIDLSESNDGMQLNLALNYGSRAEIVDAVQEIAKEAIQGKISPEEIDEELISNHLYTAGFPDPDLLIRTAGEMRISNFLLWQISYSELWVTQKYWPEFDKKDLVQAFQDFASRSRRYGGLDVN